MWRGGDDLERVALFHQIGAEFPRVLAYADELGRIVDSIDQDARVGFHQRRRAMLRGVL